MNTDSIGLIKKEIDTALKVTRDAFASKADKLIEKFATGSAKVGAGTGTWDYNLAFALVEMMKASLVAQEPSVVTVPLNKDGEIIGPVWERLLNHFFHTLDMRQKAEEAADWENVTGLCVAKVGFYSQKEAALGESGSYRNGNLFVEILDPRNFFVDPYCTKTDLSDARYCGDVVFLPKADVMNSPLYDPLMVEKISPNKVGAKYPEGNATFPRMNSDLPDEYGLIELREMHLRNRETSQIEVGTFCVNEIQPLREFAALPPEYRFFNYVPMTFFPIPGRFYGYSILQRITAVCDMMDNSMNRIAERWKHSPEKFAGPLTTMAQSAKAAVASAKMFEFIDTGEIPGNQAFANIHGQTIYNDELEYIKILLNFFHWISGMSHLEMGTGSSKTATETGFIQRAGDMRSARRMNVMERWVATIAKRMLTILRTSPEEFPLEEILGEDDVAIWQQYEQKQSEREREQQDTDIVVRMSLPINVAAITRRDKIIELLGRLGNPVLMQMMLASGQTINVAELVKKVISDSGENADNIVVPVTQEMMAQMQQGGENAPV